MLLLRIILFTGHVGQRVAVFVEFCICVIEFSTLTLASLWQLVCILHVFICQHYLSGHLPGIFVFLGRYQLLGLLQLLFLHFLLLDYLFLGLELLEEAKTPFATVCTPNCAVFTGSTRVFACCLVQYLESLRALLLQIQVGFIVALFTA